MADDAIDWSASTKKEPVDMLPDQSVPARSFRGQLQLSIPHRAPAALLAALVALSPLAALTAFASTAGNDAYSVDEDQQLVVPTAPSVPGLLDNDTTDSGTPCVLSVDTTALQGTLDTSTINDGSFTYTPPPNFHGATDFTYQLGSSSGSDCTIVPDATATVGITVNSVNDPPTAVADSFTALRGHTLNVAAPGVLANDSDVDGDALTASTTSAAAHGVVTLAADGGFSYTPAAGYVGPDAFAYRASDGTAQSLQRIVSIHVVDLPPTPSPTPAPTPTAVPPTATPEASPTESPTPSDNPLPSPSPLDTSAAASASPSPSAITGPTSSEGGPPILAIGAIGVLLGLLAVAAVSFARSQRSGEAEAVAFDESIPRD